MWLSRPFAARNADYVDIVSALCCVHFRVLVIGPFHSICTPHGRQIFHCVTTHVEFGRGTFNERAQGNPIKCHHSRQRIKRETRNFKCVIQIYVPHLISSTYTHSPRTAPRIPFINSNIELYNFYRAQPNA